MENRKTNTDNLLPSIHFDEEIMLQKRIFLLNLMAIKMDSQKAAAAVDYIFCLN